VQLEKSRIAKQKQTELLAKIQAAAVHIPKPPPIKSLKVSIIDQMTRIDHCKI